MIGEFGERISLPEENICTFFAQNQEEVNFAGSNNFVG